MKKIVYGLVFIAGIMVPALSAQSAGELSVVSQNIETQGEKQSKEMEELRQLVIKQMSENVELKALLKEFVEHGRDSDLNEILFMCKKLHEQNAAAHFVMTVQKWKIILVMVLLPICIWYGRNGAIFGARLLSLI